MSPASFQKEISEFILNTVIGAELLWFKLQTIQTISSNPRQTLSFQQGVYLHKSIIILLYIYSVYMGADNSSKSNKEVYVEQKP